MSEIFNRLEPRALLQRISLWLTTAALHLLGSATVFAASAWLLLPAASRQALQTAYHQGFFGDIPDELLLHIGLSICLWSLLWIIWKILSTAPETTKPRLVRAKGAVILETLLVLPVFLLLTLGLLQLTLLNTAGLLTTLGAFKAGRAVAVWHPEALTGRNGVDDSLVEEKAHLAAAAAIAPSAPSDFEYTDCSELNNDTFEARIDALEEQGHTTSNYSIAKSGDDRADLTLSSGFDTSGFDIRGQRKLSFAYCATTLDIQTDDGEVHVVIEYQQQMAMPIAEVVFGDRQTVAGRSAFYSTITREHRTTHQLQPPPEDESPGGTTSNPFW